MAGGRMSIGGSIIDGKEFVERVKAGDQEACRRVVSQLRTDRKSGVDRSRALEVISEAFRGKAIAFQRRFLDDPDAAEEAWNDTLLDIWQEIETYDPRRGKFSTWVLERAKYAARSRRRQLAKERRRVGIGGSHEETSDPLSRLEQTAIRRAFRRLNTAQQKLVLLHAVGGQTPGEIAAGGHLPSVPADHVRVYVNRAYARLRTLHQEELAS